VYPHRPADKMTGSDAHHVAAKGAEAITLLGQVSSISIAKSLFDQAANASTCKHVYMAHLVEPLFFVG
jgi:hypothetical protein